jgi:hypothetical protein
MKKKNSAVMCKDGFIMSVQASSHAYCSPREDNSRYHEVEVGYPSEVEPLLMPYAENPSKPTQTVYGYVPCSTVYLVITKHGGMVRGTVPSGVPVYEHMWSGDKNEDR